MDLAEFIAARLDEDEAAAEAAPGAAWTAHTEDDIAGASVYDEQWVLLYPERYDHDNALSNRPGATGPQYIQRARNELAAHIARHDPARVLREVAAKRAILARHKPLQGVYGSCCAWCSDDVDAPRLNKPWPCEDVRDLVTAWSDHPDFSGDWKP